MNPKVSKKKSDIKKDIVINNISSKLTIDEINAMFNIGESHLRTYEMLRNKFLNIK